MKQFGFIIVVILLLSACREDIKKTHKTTERSESIEKTKEEGMERAREWANSDTLSTEEDSTRLKDPIISKDSL